MNDPIPTRWGLCLYLWLVRLNNKVIDALGEAEGLGGKSEGQ
jgi:hypothetical protein